MSENQTLLPWLWVDGYGSRRPMLPSEMRDTSGGTRRLLPWARAEMDRPRPLLPWEHRTGNDWRGLRA
jgi:hypothetical protein